MNADLSISLQLSNSPLTLQLSLTLQFTDEKWRKTKYFVQWLHKLYII